MADSLLGDVGKAVGDIAGSTGAPIAGLAGIAEQLSEQTAAIMSADGGPLDALSGAGSDVFSAPLGVIVEPHTFHTGEIVSDALDAQPESAISGTSTPSSSETADFGVAAAALQRIMEQDETFTVQIRSLLDHQHETVQDAILHMDGDMDGDMDGVPFTATSDHAESSAPDSSHADATAISHGSHVSHDDHVADSDGEG